MARLVPALLLAILGAGCTWAWDDFAGSDGGPVGMDAGVDAGPAPVDTGPPEDATRPEDSGGGCGDFDRVCAAGELCARASELAGCCLDPGCVEFSDRPIAWATWIDGSASPDGVIRADETHWARAPSYPLTSVGSAMEPPLADASAYFQVAWGSSGLHIHVHVVDDLHMSDSGSSIPIDEVDSVEVFLHFDPSTDGSITGTRLVVELLDGRGAFEVDGPAPLRPVVASKRNGVGFDMEIQLFWSDFAGSVPLPGIALGLDVTFHDVDAAPPSAVRESWRWSRCDRPQADVAGLVILGAATPPPMPTCAQTCSSTLCAPSMYRCDRASPQLCN